MLLSKPCTPCRYQFFSPRLSLSASINNFFASLISTSSSCVGDAVCAVELGGPPAEGVVTWVKSIVYSWCE